MSALEIIIIPEFSDTDLCNNLISGNSLKTRMFIMNFVQANTDHQFYGARLREIAIKK